MITIVLKNIVFDGEIDLEKRRTVYLEISGHSYLSSKGSDILCSAISALSQTFILTVSKILKIKQQISRDSGFLSSFIALDEISAEDKSKLKLFIEYFKKL